MAVMSADFVGGCEANGRRQSGGLEARRGVIFIHFWRFSARRRRVLKVQRSATLENVSASAETVGQSHRLTLFTCFTRVQKAFVP